MSLAQVRNVLDLMPPGRRAGLLMGGVSALQERFGLTATIAQAAHADAMTTYRTKES